MHGIIWSKYEIEHMYEAWNSMKDAWDTIDGAWNQVEATELLRKMRGILLSVLGII
jgi:hypothetical protein